MDEMQFNTEADAQDFLDDVDAELGYPKRGINIGQGPHVQMPATYTEGAQGWTQTEASIFERTDGKFVVEVTSGVNRAANASAVDISAKVPQDLPGRATVAGPDGPVPAPPRPRRGRN